MKKLTLALTIAAALASPLSISAQNLSMDDFLPPVSAPAEKQKELSEVSGEVSEAQDKDFGVNVVEAETTQDAINFVANKRSAGAEMIRTGSGIGWVATGIGNYMAMDNPTATAIDKRNAYVRAFLQAQRNLAEALTGLSTEGKNRVVEEMKSIVDENSDMTSLMALQEESIEQSVEMLMRGFVVYSVEDNPDENTVLVSIVSTPKTRGSINNVSSEGLQAQSINEGIDYVLTEIQSGILPPVGGKIVQVPESNEIAFVGFGSDIIRFSNNKALQAKNRLNAERVAKARASDALAGVILGDNASWKGKLDESTQTIITEFEEIPVEEGVNRERFDEAKESFINTQVTKDEYESLRSGILPPGVMSRTFTNDRDEVYAVSIYLPSLSKEASAAAKEMSNSQIIKDSPNKAPQRSSEVKQGPTGQVSNDADL